MDGTAKRLVVHEIIERVVQGRERNCSGNFIETGFVLNADQRQTFFFIQNKMFEIQTVLSFEMRNDGIRE